MPGAAAHSSPYRAAARAAREVLAALAEARVKRRQDLEHLSRFLMDLGAIVRFAGAGRLIIEWGQERQPRPDGVHELYFDLYRGRQPIGYVGRTWEDPGARIGDVLRVADRHRDLIKRRIKLLVDTCAGQGVTLHLHRVEGHIELHVWTPVYGSPVSPDGLAEALRALESCKRQLRKIVPFH